MTDKTVFNQAEVRQAALLEELQTQRGFLGDRAANLAADLAIALATIEQQNAQIAGLQKELDEWKTKAEPELPLGT